MSSFVRTILGKIESQPTGYEQLINYTMLYDEGNECADVTGGWISYTDSSWGAGTTTKNANSLYLSASNTNQRAMFRTNNRFDTGAYKTSFVVGKYSISASNSNNKVRTLWEASDKTCAVESVITSVATDKSIVAEMPFDKSYTGLQCIITAYSHLSGNTTKFNVSYVGMVKPDDFQSLCSKAGVSASSLENLLADTSALTTIFNNEDAVNFMVAQCTGDFMVGVLNSESAVALLKASPYLNTVVGNPHWAKFIMMIPTAKELLNVTMLYDNGYENVTWKTGATSGGVVTKNANAINYTATNKYATLVTTEKVDFANETILFTALNIKSAASNPQIATRYGSNADGDTGSTVLKSISVAAMGKISQMLDVSTLNDAYYLALQPNATMTSNTTINVDIECVAFIESDDWQAWASKAGITATSLDTLLADSTAMNQLMSNEAAVKYLRGCTGDLMIAICNSETAMQAVVNNIAYDYLFDHPVWYKFMTMCPVALAAMDSVAIKVPTMTGYTTPSGEVTGSSYVAGSANSYPWHAFNKQVGDSDNARWFTQYPAVFPEYVQYDFEERVEIYKAEILTASVKNNQYSTVKDFVIKASNDGVSFDDIYAGTLENQWSNYVPVILPKNEGYRYWRFQINSGFTSDYSGLMELQYYGKAVD